MGINYQKKVITKHNNLDERDVAGTHPSTSISVDDSNMSGLLNNISSTPTVQNALEIIDDVNASNIPVNTSTFNGRFTSEDNTAQKIFEKIDDLLTTNIIVEQHEVLTGAKTITLVNTPGASDYVEIIDTTYGVQWIKNVDWSISSNVVTFTETMVEDLTFIIKNYGS